MGFGFGKQPASMPQAGACQVIQCATGAAVATAKFGVATQQVRVLSQLPAWGSFGQTTGDTVQASSAGGVGFMLTGGSSSGVSLYAGVFPEYFVVRPGQLMVVASTSTSSFAVSVTEMS